MIAHRYREFYPSCDLTVIDSDLTLINCTQFYQCGVGGAALQPCGVGTIFSPRHKDCRRPEEAKCVTLEKYLEIKKIELEDFYEELEY